MQKLTILSDMDGIFVDLCPYWLKCIERDHGVVCTQAEIDQWAMHKCGNLKQLGAEKVYAYLKQEGFFRNAPFLPGGIEALRVLKEAGHDVFVVTSPSGPISAKEKYEVLEQYLPFIPSDRIFLGNKKSMIDADVIIDDHPETLAAYQTKRPDALCMGISYPYNAMLKTNKKILLADDYTRSEAAWAQMLYWIDNFANGLVPETGEEPVQICVMCKSEPAAPGAIHCHNAACIPF